MTTVSHPDPERFLQQLYDEEERIASGQGEWLRGVVNARVAERAKRMGIGEQVIELAVARLGDLKDRAQRDALKEHATQIELLDPEHVLALGDGARVKTGQAEKRHWDAWFVGRTRNHQGQVSAYARDLALYADVQARLPHGQTIDEWQASNCIQ